MSIPGDGLQAARGARHDILRIGIIKYNVTTYKLIIIEDKRCPPRRPAKILDDTIASYVEWYSVSH